MDRTTLFKITIWHGELVIKTRRTFLTINILIISILFSRPMHNQKKYIRNWNLLKKSETLNRENHQVFCLQWTARKCETARTITKKSRGSAMKTRGRFAYNENRSIFRREDMCDSESTTIVELSVIMRAEFSQTYLYKRERQWAL